MNLYRIACAIGLMLIAGCSTPGDIRKKMPTLDLNSAKNAKAVAGCIADGWEEANTASGLNTRPTANGYTVWKTEHGFGQEDTPFVIDITDAPNGSNTLFYSKMFRQEDKAIKVIRNCQGEPATATTLPAGAKSEIPTPVNESISEKLRELQTLRKEGIITEEDYQKKKQQLLDKFQ